MPPESSSARSIFHDILRYRGRSRHRPFLITNPGIACCSGVLICRFFFPFPRPSSRPLSSYVRRSQGCRFGFWMKWMKYDLTDTVFVSQAMSLSPTHTHPIREVSTWSSSFCRSSTPSTRRAYRPSSLNLLRTRSHSRS